MNSMLATEPTTLSDEKRTTLPPLETSGANERMRHVPPLDWMIRKIDADVRSRIAKLTANFASLPSSDPHYATIEAALRELCSSMERITATAGNRRSAEPAGMPLTARIDSAIAHAVAALRGLEGTPFGRRAPYHVFERSRSEPVYGALLGVIDHVARLVPLIRSIDRDIDEKLLA